MPVRIGFVGTGGIAGYHFNDLEKIADAKVVGLFDVATDKAEVASHRFPDSQVYKSFEEMLDQARLDALYVCLPPFAHQEYERQAAERGINLFVEKPIQLDLAKAEGIAKTIAEHKVIAAVGYNWRWQDTTDAARQALAGKSVALALGYWIGGFPQVGWWRRKGQSGGQAVEQTTHMFDLVRYLLGEVESVYAIGSVGLMTEWEGYDIEDASTATLRFKSGAVASISSADVAPRGAGTIGLTLYSRDLVVEVTLNKVRVSTPARTEETLPDVNPYLLEDQAFVRAVASGDASALRSTYADAVRTLAVCLAVNESIATGKIVSL